MHCVSSRSDMDIVMLNLLPEEFHGHLVHSKGWPRCWLSWLPSDFDHWIKGDIIYTSQFGRIFSKLLSCWISQISHSATAVYILQFHVTGAGSWLYCNVVTNCRSPGWLRPWQCRQQEVGREQQQSSREARHRTRHRRHWRHRRHCTSGEGDQYSRGNTCTMTGERGCNFVKIYLSAAMSRHIDRYLHLDR